MKNLNIFVIFWIFIGIVLLMASLFYKKQSDAIVAEVEPQKIAISFQKAVKIKSIHVIPGEDVNKGDLLVEVVRPDLLYDIDKASNDLNTLLQQKDMFITNLNYQIQMTLLEKMSEVESIDEDNVWVFWKATVVFRNPGLYTVNSRATDIHGNVQPEDDPDSRDGTNSWPSVTVSAVSLL